MFAPILWQIFTPQRHKGKPWVSGDGRPAFFGGTDRRDAVKVRPETGAADAAIGTMISTR
jgi:hypothetical protein